MKLYTVCIIFSLSTRKTNTSACESFWDDYDDSIFSEICDLEEMEKVNIDQELKTNNVTNNLLSTNTENTTKRKYCTTESNKPHQCQDNIEEHNKIMIKKLKHNSLFKF